MVLEHVPPHTHLVIHIRYVHHKFDLVPEEVLHNTSYDVGRNIVPSMAQMGIIINRGPTRVPLDKLRFPFYGYKRSFGASEGVVDPQCGQRTLLVWLLRSSPRRLLACNSSHVPMDCWVESGALRLRGKVQRPIHDMEAEAEEHQVGKYAVRFMRTAS